MRTRSIVFLCCASVIATSILSVACGSSKGTPAGLANGTTGQPPVGGKDAAASDAGSDGTTDSGMVDSAVATTDSGASADSGAESAAPPPGDSGMEASADSGADGARDSATEASVDSSAGQADAGPLTGATAIALGGAYDNYSQACALLAGGTVACWGDDQSGELGVGSSTGPATCMFGYACAKTPVAVPALTGVTAISAGGADTCALLAGGTLDCWGDQNEDELGLGTTGGPDVCVQNTACSTSPLAVPTLSGVTAVAVGNAQVCALVAGGTVKCWGTNLVQNEPMLGTPVPSPTTVPGLTGVTAIAVGGFHACALLAGGTVECWGDNTFGQLGNGTGLASATPVAVSSLHGVTAITAGYEWTCALIAGGTADCWGFNSDGELGNGMTMFSLTPVAVSNLTRAIAIAAGGGDSTCALLQGGTVKCWGGNMYGELGNASPSPSLTPTTVSGLTGVTAISVGAYSACALLSGGTVECWGANVSGQLGDGLVSNSSVPVSVSAP
jgi:alpha-tubulin suppressor-like RCC1 family protein